MEPAGGYNFEPKKVPVKHFDLYELLCSLSILSPFETWEYGDKVDIKDLRVSFFHNFSLYEESEILEHPDIDKLFSNKPISFSYSLDNREIINIKTREPLTYREIIEACRLTVILAFHKQVENLEKEGRTREHFSEYRVLDIYHGLEECCGDGITLHGTGT